MKKIFTSALLLLLALTTLLSLPGYVFLSREYARLESDNPLVWEPAITAFEEEDRQNPPPADPLVFVGSSSIRFWSTLKEDMAPLPVIRRGFGGAKLNDVIHYANRIIYKYQPKAVVLFAGANDISGRANDKTPEDVYHDFVILASGIRSRLPNTKLFYLAITPTTARWQIWHQAQKANELIAAYMELQPDMTFLETDSVFLNKNGRPREELLWWDGVHLNEKGYQRWTELVKPRLLELYE